jgi:hypothetical protein
MEGTGSSSADVDQDFELTGRIVAKIRHHAYDLGRFDLKSELAERHAVCSDCTG